MSKVKNGLIAMVAMLSMTVFADDAKTSQLLKNGDFSEGKTGWSPWVTPAVARDVEIKFENNQFEVAIMQKLPNQGSLQLMQRIEGLQVGDDLCLTFEAMSVEKEGKADVSMTQSGKPFGICGLYKGVIFPKEWKKYEFSFKLTKATVDNPAALRIFLGKLEPGTYLLRKFSLTKVISNN